MTDDEAEAKAQQMWPNCEPYVARRAGCCLVGWSDGEFNYTHGIGPTWEEAFAMADQKRYRGKETAS